jgi:predicted RNase H-like HicB family nuclease
MAYYVGILEGEGDVWSIRIPDLPGCHGGGASPEAAVADAISAAREWASDVAGDGHPVPAPRPILAVIADPDAEFNPAAGEGVVMIPLLLDRARPVRANLSLDAGLLEAIDAEAARRGLTRSAFLASAALDKIIAGR